MGPKKEEFLFYFAGIQREKGVTTYISIPVAFWEEFEETICIFGFLSKRHPSSRKDRPNQSSESEDIVDLKSIVLAFSRDGWVDCKVDIL